MLHGADDPNRIGLLPHEKPPRESPSFRKGNWSINWINTIVVLSPPVLLLGAILYGVPLTLSTFIVGVVMYALNGLSITGGYHRLFSHRSYVAHPIVQQFFLWFGAGAMQGSCQWWSRNHRIHHQPASIDTDRDPYNAKRGFWYSHMGWMIMKQDYGILSYVDISDLKANKYVRWQHDNYLLCAMTTGIILPTVLCGLISGDWVGGYFYAAIGKVFFVHQSTFFINSLAHSSFFGATQPFSENHTSHDSVVCSLLALGEGYHNLHHEFPSDYRNALEWYQYDPTKWVIRTLEFLGFAKHLIRTPDAVLQRNRSTVQHNKAEREMAEAKRKLAQLDAKTAVPTVWTWADVESKVLNENRKLMVVGDYVLDIERPIQTGAGYTHKDQPMDWCKVHPGGYKILDAYIGKDATDAMTGDVYKHSEGAFNLLQHLRVASIKRD